MRDTYVSDCRPLLAHVPARVAGLREPLDRTKPQAYGEER